MLTQAFDLLVEEGDTVLVEAPTYAGALAPLRPLQPNLVEVPVDAQGVIPSQLASILLQLEMEGKRRPKLLYIIPTGQNPAGCTLSFERKQEIYALACRYDFIILEDDPYWFLTYGLEKAPEEGSEQEEGWKRPVTQSFLSMDTQGRVLRLDSFSKVLSSGMRLGMVTGPTAFVKRMDLVLQASALHTSAVSQMLAFKLLTHWGVDGWNGHIRSVCLFYARRRDVFVALVEKHLKGMVTYTVPEAGMFVYFKLHGIENSKTLVMERALQALVLLVPGQAFSPNDTPSDCVRASFSTASDADMETALQRFAALLKEAVAEEAAAAAAPSSASAAATSAAMSSAAEETVEAISLREELYIAAPYWLMVSGGGSNLVLLDCPSTAPTWPRLKQMIQEAAPTTVAVRAAALADRVPTNAAATARRVRVSVAFAEECAARIRSEKDLLKQLHSIVGY